MGLEKGEAVSQESLGIVMGEGPQSVKWGNREAVRAHLDPMDPRRSPATINTAADVSGDFRSRLDGDPRPSPRTELQDAKVLLVDDDALTVRSLERVLRSQGCKVVTATSVQGARQQIAQAEGDLDAAVVDFFLLDERGADLIAELRHRPTPCSALMITGRGEREAARAAIAAGAHDFLLKPFEVSDFVAAVGRTIRRTKVWRERLGRLSPGASMPGQEASAGQVGRKQRAQGLPDLIICADRLAKRGNLSAREREILEQLLIGRRNSEIAGVLGITARTVKFHVANILRKLGADSRGDVLRLLFDDEQEESEIDL